MLVIEVETIPPSEPLTFKVASLDPFSEYLFCTMSFLFISFPTAGPQESAEKFLPLANFRTLYMDSIALPFIRRRLMKHFPSGDTFTKYQSQKGQEVMNN